MPFLIHNDLSHQDEFLRLKDAGDRMLEEKGLADYTIEVRPATQLEEKAVAGEGLAPVEDSGDNFVIDTLRMVVYRTETAENPLLVNLDDPESCARTLVDRLSEHLEQHGTDV